MLSAENNNQIQPVATRVPFNVWWNGLFKQVFADIANSIRDPKTTAWINSVRTVSANDYISSKKKRNSISKPHIFNAPTETAGCSLLCGRTPLLCLCAIFPHPRFKMTVRFVILVSRFFGISFVAVIDSLESSSTLEVPAPFIKFIYTNLIGMSEGQLSALKKGSRYSNSTKILPSRERKTPHRIKQIENTSNTTSRNERRSSIELWERSRKSLETLSGQTKRKISEAELFAMVRSCPTCKIKRSSVVGCIWRLKSQQSSGRLIAHGKNSKCENIS